MTKKDYTEILFILDRSGSMSSIQDDAIGGFNAFIEEQKKQPGTCRLTLVQFDNSYEVVYDAIQIMEAPKLTNKTFVPRGSTALRDAMGKSINALGVRLRAMSTEQRPSNVIVAIMTDGQENASREFGMDKINDMITEQQDKYDWDFIFLAANQDAVATASSYGIAKGMSLGFTGDSKGIRSSMRAVSYYTGMKRSGVVCGSLVAEVDPNGTGIADEDVIDNLVKPGSK